MEDRIGYFERMPAGNPENPTGLLELADEYGKAERYEDEAAVLQRYVATQERECTGRRHVSWLRFRARLTEDGGGLVEMASA